jgi:hypothetical protein
MLSPENGTEYFEIIFNVVNQKDLTLEQYKEIECFIYDKLKQIENEY